MIQRATPPPHRHAPRQVHAGPWFTIFAAGTVARLAAWRLTHGTPVLPPDPRLAEVSSHLSRGLGFSLGTGGTHAPTATIPPLPPALLAAVAATTGERTWLEGSLACAMGALAALLVARLATTLFGPTVGRVAGVCAALSPLLLHAAGLLEPSVFACALGLAMVTSAEWLRTPRRGRALATGVAWGACVLSGTRGIVAFPATLAWAWPPLGLELPGRERLRQVAFVGLGFLCVVAPWALRNALVLHAFAPVTTSSGAALLAGNNPVLWGVPARRAGRLDVLREEPYASRFAPLGEPARDSLAWSEARAFLSHRSPGELARVAAERLGRLWSARVQPDDAGAEPSRVGIAARLLGIAEALFMLLAAWGAMRSVSGPRRWFQSLPVVAIATLTTAAMLVSGSSGARLAVEPLVALLAAVGFRDARRGLRLRRRGLRVIPGAADRRIP